MKFQASSLNSLKVRVGTKKCDPRMHPCTLQKQYAPPTFSKFDPFWIDISLLLAALLKQEITVSFLWLSLPVHSGSLKRI